MRERLFAVHVFAGLGRVDAGQVMPMLGRGIDDDIHILAL